MKTKLILSFVALAAVASAADLTLTWDRAPETNVTHYLLHYKAGSDGYSPQPYVVPAATNAVMVTNLLAGVRYTFAVQAVNELEICGELSDPLSFTIPNPEKPSKLVLRLEATLWVDGKPYRIIMDDAKIERVSE